MSRSLSWRFLPALTAAVLASLLPSGAALAVPSFARQTGFECTACHLSWPELTTVGRQFKLGGYTLIRPSTGDRPIVSMGRDGDPPLLPLAAFVQVSMSHTARTGTGGTDASTFLKQNDLVLQQASLFLAGRIAEHAGGFVQWSYDGVAKRSQVDNVDLRLTNRWRTEGHDVLYGLSLNNSPTMSDIFNTTPVWGFPFAGSSVAATPAASTLIQEGLAQQVVGLTGYAQWNKTVYAELGGYRTADKSWSVLRAGTPRDEDAHLASTAPYWRLALQHEWGDGEQSAMVGAFGLTARRYPDPMDTGTPTDRFADVGIDAQYQYITDAHRIGAQVSAIRESQRWDGSSAGGATANPRDSLRNVSAKVSWYRDMTYGVSLGWQQISGSTDAGLYSTGEPVFGSASGSPNSKAWIVELNWLPWRDRRFTLQYTGYRQFNGGKTNYDGFGRNASDNNTWHAMAWLMF
jgi:hypothetical protein